MSEAETEAMLAKLFGNSHAAFWPTPCPSRPKWFEPRQRKLDDAIGAAVQEAGGSYDKRFRDLYWREVRIGQCAHEDAGGYFWRCWAAAFGFDVERGETTGEMAARLIKERIAELHARLPAARDESNEDGGKT